jgi:homogentisate 1,2-dioxygenase
LFTGNGTIESQYGTLDFMNDYIIIPRGVIYKINYKSDKQKFLVIESRSPVYTPKDIKQLGQHLKYLPFVSVISGFLQTCYDK